MEMLRIYLLGRMRVTFADIEADFTHADLKLTHTTQALLAYLLIHRHRSHSRDTLAALFWGDQPDEKARGSLNTALWRLRSYIEPAGTPPGTYLVSNNGGDVCFNSHSHFWLDIAHFEETAARILAYPIESAPDAEIEQLEAALTLYNGELLEGFYDDWALRERERLRSLYLNSLAYLMHRYKHIGSYQNGIFYGQKILENDPLREEIHRELIRIYLASGQRSQAVRQYEQCCSLLQQELGIEPMEETKSLYLHLTGGSSKGLEPAAETHPSQIDANLIEAMGQLRQTAEFIGLLQAQLWLAIESIESLIKQAEK